MKTSIIAKVVCTAGLAAACVMGLAACSEEAAQNEGGTGAVAATVNGVEIYEDDITAYIDSVRASMALETEEAWGEWMVSAGYTPESIREMIVESYIDQELLRQGAIEKGVVADEETINSYVNSMKSYYNSDEEWQAALSSAGLTEEEYRESIELSLLQEGLTALFATDEPATEEELLSYLSLYGSMFDGAKRSSHILFAADDAVTAQEVLDKINSGELDFAAAAAEYSQDTGSAADGGNVGLDVMTTFVDEYQTALDALAEGEVSGLVESSYGIHIIKCTYVFSNPAEPVSSDQYPEEMVEAIESTIASSKQSAAYSEWLTEYRESIEIVINPIPADVSYNIDMTPYEQAEEEASDDAAEGEGTTEGEDAATEGDTGIEGEAEGSEGDAAAAE